MVGLVVFAVAGLVLVVLWRWIDDLALVEPEKKATAHLDAVKTASAIAVGGGGLFALYLAARRQRTQELELAQRDHAQDHAEQVAETTRRHAEQVAADTRDDAAARRVTELFTRASEQLGSDKAPVRMAGLYALERLAQDNPHQRPTVVNVLCAYLRMPFAPPDAPPTADEQARALHEGRVREREVRLTAQRVLRDHLRPGPDPDRPVDAFWPDTDLDLTGATLVDFDLTGCRPRHTRFGGATFAGDARFGGTTFAAEAEFGGAVFAGLSGFSETTFVGDARFGGATFAGPVGFGGARFAGDAGFAGATFTRTAAFVKATFAGDAGFFRVRFAGAGMFGVATFHGDATFGGATFGGDAGFGGATFAGDAGFSCATFSRAAVFIRARFAGIAVFGGATFAGDARFRGAMFARDALFGGADFARGGEFGGAVTVHPRPSRSTWPTGWRPADEHGPVDGCEGTWHRLVPIQPDQ